MDHYDIAIVGAGLAGSLAALALVRTGRSVVLVAPPAGPDRRTTAVMDEALELVRSLGLSEAIDGISAPLASLRIVDATDRLLRAPVVTFRAAEIGLDAFGRNVPNALFIESLSARIADAPSITRRVSSLSSFETDATRAILRLEDGTSVSAALVIGADGRRSRVRTALDIGAKCWTYPQTAVVLNFTHEKPHDDTSTEFHTPDGPFTQVPLPGRLSSLVWVMTPAAAVEHLSLAPEALSIAVETRMQSMLGKVTVEDGAQSFPLSGMTAERFGKGRAILIGEAAHAFPPIGAQGLNLSLRDVMTITRLLDETAGMPADIADRYDRRRRADILSRTVSVDLLNRSLLTGFLPVQLLRAGGLQALASAAPLRGLMMREGLRPGSAVRSLMSGLREKIGRQPA